MHARTAHRLGSYQDPGTTPRAPHGSIARRGKLALPVQAAQYYALLARALPGTSLHDMQWSISLVMGWSLIHAAGILHGECFIWPDPRLSRVGRTFLKAKNLRQQSQRDWAKDLDL